MQSTTTVRLIGSLLLGFVTVTAVAAAQAPAASTSGVAAPTAPAPAQSPLPVAADEVVTHVSQSIAWYRRIVALQQLPADPQDMISHERLNETALRALRLAFDFGRAAAALAEVTTPGKGQPGKTASPEETGGAAQPGSAGGTASGFDRAAARLADRITTLQGQLSGVEEQLAHAKPADRSALTAQRDELVAALDFAKEMQSTVGQLQRFEEASDIYAGEGSSGLAGRIADLQRSVPEARRSAAARTSPGGAGGASAGTTGGGGSNTAAAAPAPTPATTAAAAQAAFRPESAGVIALVGEWFSLTGARRDLNDAMKQTDDLLKRLDSMREQLTQQVRTVASQDLAATPTDATQLAQAREQLATAAARFKQLSTLLVPLGEQGITVDGARSSLVEWHNSLESRCSAVARYLALRILVLLGSIALVLAVSDVWRRATFRYLRDGRRRAQFLALRRVAVGAALTLVIVFGLISEVGSVATYAGLITAGLAVALQNVILAVVAYFFLIGRYGVRVGDRITLAGVTGRVVDIGLIRIYLMELIGPEQRSSGRMVVLSNAVLFQPTALFKQMPGGDYFWHTVTLTFAATTEVQTVEDHLRAAAQAVYEHYRPAIERQHAALQRFIDFETAMPQPEMYLRLTENGLECTVRYPVEPAQAASIDQKMLAAIREALSKDADLKLVSGPFLKGDT